MRKKAIVLKTVIGLLLLVSMLVILGYRETIYVDIMNGDTRNVVKVFGIPVLSSHYQTDYSKLVKDFHLTQNPQWEIAFEKNHGLAYFFYPSSTSTSYHRLLAAMRDVPLLMRLDYLDDPTTTIQKMLTLTLSGKPEMSQAIITDIMSEK